MAGALLRTSQRTSADTDSAQDIGLTFLPNDQNPMLPRLVQSDQNSILPRKEQSPLNCVGVADVAFDLRNRLAPHTDRLDQRQRQRPVVSDGQWIAKCRWSGCVQRLIDLWLSPLTEHAFNVDCQDVARIDHVFGRCLLTKVGQIDHLPVFTAATFEFRWQKSRWNSVQWTNRRAT